MKNTNIIRNFLTGGFALLVLTTTVFASSTIRFGTGTGVGSAINFFRQDLGGANNGTGNSYTSGRREINWDDLPENLCQSPSTDIRKFYNANVPRGMVLADDQSYRCSRTPNFGGQNEVARFGNINPNYVQYFNVQSQFRLFAPTGKPEFNIRFFVPGTKIPATVSGFGIVFSDKDNLENGVIILYDAAGEEISRHLAPNQNNDISFVGVSYNDGTRIAAVRVLAGNAVLGASEAFGSGIDVVAVDDIIYGEPRAAVSHPSDFDGDGTSDYAVFRPSNGTWYWINSGSNTFSAAQFGANGDVPVDGDFDGDSRTDLTVFRPSNGTWYVLRSSNNQFQSTTFGLAGDKPVAGDYDNDGKTDVAVWRPSNGTYYYLKSSNGQFGSAQFGATGDIPIGSAQ